MDGCLNPSADAVERVNETWSDTNLNSDFSQRVPNGYRWQWTTFSTFTRLVCRTCGGVQFEVLRTDDYETTAHCACGMYYIVHNG